MAKCVVCAKAIKISGGQYTIKDNLDNRNTVVAVSASGEDLYSNIDSSFGRCEYFLVVKVKDGKVIEVKPFENLNAKINSGSAIGAAEMLVNLKVNAIIGINFGAKALDTLKKFGISVYKSSGIAVKSVESFIDNDLTKL